LDVWIYRCIKLSAIDAHENVRRYGGRRIERKMAVDASEELARKPGLPAVSHAIADLILRAPSR
jgi:hypothetical protein